MPFDNLAVNDYRFHVKWAATYMKDRDDGSPAEAMGSLLSGCRARLSSLQAHRLIQPFWNEMGNANSAWTPTDAQRSGLDSVRNGTGLVVFFHVTHHAGTSFLDVARHNALRMPGTRFTGHIWNPTHAHDGARQADIYLQSGYDLVSIERDLPESFRFNAIFDDPRLLFVD